MKSPVVSFLVGLLPAAAVASPASGPRATDQFDAQSYASVDVITRDVAVIGGGASGIYAAMNLRALGKSVVVVEKQAELGGHTNTYIDPATGTPVNYGLQAYHNISVAEDYFDLLGIPLGPFQFNPVTRTYYDFKTGQTVVPPPPSPGLGGYAAQLANYPSLEYSWDLPNPVPADLLLPFRDFLAKYNIQDEAYTVYFSGQGFANILDQLTVHVFKMVGMSFIRSITGQAFQPASGNNAEIYAKALPLLGPDALLSSTVIASKRPSDHSGIKLVVKTGNNNKLRLIKAKKLLITAPPLLSNLLPFDLDANEKSLFAKWSHTNYFVMLVANTGLPSGFQYANAVASNATLNIPSLPAAYQITETRVPGLFYVWYGSPVAISEAAVKADVVATIKRVRPAAGSTSTATPSFVKFESHSPFKLVVSKEAILGGFYQKLKALQGRRDTWYTGAAFISHDCSLVWNFTASLLPQIAA